MKEFIFYHSATPYANLADVTKMAINDQTNGRQMMARTSFIYREKHWRIQAVEKKLSGVRGTPVALEKKLKGQEKRALFKEAEDREYGN